MSCATITETVSVTIAKTPVSASVRDDGFTDVMFLRVVVKDSDGSEIARDVVRETLSNASSEAYVAELLLTRCPHEAHGSSDES